MHVDRIVPREAWRAKRDEWWEEKPWGRYGTSLDEIEDLNLPGKKLKLSCSFEVMTLFVLIIMKGRNETSWLIVAPPPPYCQSGIFFLLSLRQPFSLYSLITLFHISSLFVSDLLTLSPSPSLSPIVVVVSLVALPPLPLSHPLIFSDSLPPLVCLLSWFARLFIFILLIYFLLEKADLLTLYAFKQNSSERKCMTDSWSLVGCVHASNTRINKSVL